MTCYHCRQPGHMRRDYPRRQRSQGTADELTGQPNMRGTFLLLHLLTRVAFKFDASNSFIVASCVIESGLEVEAFREAMCGCSSLGGRVRVDRIDQDFELEISEILLMVDPWGGGGGGGGGLHRVGYGCTVTSHRVGCGCTVWSFTTLSECGLGLSLGLRPMKTHNSNQGKRSN